MWGLLHFLLVLNLLGVNDVRVHKLNYHWHTKYGRDILYSDTLYEHIIFLTLTSICLRKTQVHDDRTMLHECWNNVKTLKRRLLDVLCRLGELWTIFTVLFSRFLNIWKLFNPQISEISGIFHFFLSLLLTFLIWFQTIRRNILWIYPNFQVVKIFLENTWKIPCRSSYNYFRHE